MRCQRKKSKRETRKNETAFRHKFGLRWPVATRCGFTFYVTDLFSSIHPASRKATPNVYASVPATQSELMRLDAMRFLIGVTSVYLAGACSTFAQEKPQPVASESPSNVQEPRLAEKIRDVSPDKKFAMRISYDAALNNQAIKAEHADADKIFSQTIKAIELISMPNKSVAVNLSADAHLGGEYDYILLVWSPDSKWCAFYATAPRFGYTTVYKQSGDKFVPLTGHDDVSVEIGEGQLLHEYIRPVKWTKPGELILEQSAIFSHGSGDEKTIRFTVKFDEKTDEFRIISKKRVTLGLPHGYD
jgi:hypothetical protein